MRMRRSFVKIVEMYGRCMGDVWGVVEKCGEKCGGKGGDEEGRDDVGVISTLFVPIRACWGIVEGRYGVC
jgi:hypothetical protein